MPTASRRVSKKRVSRNGVVTVTPGSTTSTDGTQPDRWSSGSTFVLAIAGAAIGFKTIWQFPYVASENGGGAFILVYLVLSLVLGAPLLIVQMMLGRRVHASPIRTMGELGVRVPGKRKWAIVGAIAVAGGFIVFSYLSVIAGWTIAYFIRAAFGALSGLTVDGMGSLLAAFVRDPEKQVFWHSLFTLSVVAIAARGLRLGVEPAVRWLVPLLYGILVALTVYAIRNSGFQDVARYLLSPDFSKITPEAWLHAAAQVFFSLGLGTGVALMYGAYLRSDVSIARAGLTVVGLDVLTSVVAAVFVFGILFGGGVAPASGPNLMFQVLPLAFDHLPYGRWAVSAFFALLVIIALVMGLALLEPVIVWLDERFELGRPRAAMLSGFGAWALGLITVFSFNYASFSFKLFGIEKTLGAFDILQSLTAEAMLPLAGLAVAVFGGWVLRPAFVREELAMRSAFWFDVWLWLLRLLVPPLMLVLLFALYRL